MDIGLILFIILFTLLYLNPNNVLFRNLNSTMIFSSLFLIFIILLIIFPSQSFKSAQFGFNLWLNIVFPSLFPFFVASELLNGTGLMRVIGVLLEPIMRPLFNVPGVGSFAFAMGISSGYPVGAKITADFRKSDLCTKTEAERLLAFTNNSSPLFITGAIATGILGHPEIGLILLGCHIAASITVGILFRFYKKNKKETALIQSNQDSRHKIHSMPMNLKNIGQKLGDSIKNSINTLLMICGFIVIFCVIINLLISLKFVYFIASCFYFLFQWLNIDSNMASAIISGFFEITTGASYTTYSISPITQKIVASAFIVGWGGLSVHAQVASIIADTDISIKPYLTGKFLQGIFSAAYTLLTLKISGILSSQNVLASQYSNFHLNSDWLVYSTAPLPILFLLCVYLVLQLCRRVPSFSFRSSPNRSKLRNPSSHHRH